MLLVDAGLRSRIHFVPGETFLTPTPWIGRLSKSKLYTYFHLAGLQTPTCRADPVLGARVNVLGTLAVFKTAARAEGPGPADRLRELGDPSTDRPTPTPRGVW